MDKIVKMMGPATSAWGRLSPVQKAAATITAVLAFVALVVAVSMAGRPQYSVLFSNLSAGDAGAIVDKLKETKVDYRITAGGAAIEVPQDQVYDLRLQLAGEGLPQGGTVGFEIFDKSSFGMTEFTQKLNYQRALQGELARTIGELSSVDQARVHLAIPEQNLYEDDKKDPTASIVVKLRPGAQLGQDEVAAITHLVSAAVEGLKPGGVAVVDTNGNLLSDADNSGPLSANGLRLSASQFQMQKQYEAQMGRDLQTMLEKVLGPGKAIVRVNARMNFDAKETDSEIYEPGPKGVGVLASQDEQRETYTGAPKGVPGAPALSAALGGANGAIAKTAASGDNYLRTQGSTRYDVTKHVEHVTQAPGKVEKVSVAVLMDGNVTPAVTATIKETVSSAIGLDAQRGDTVTVDALPFDNSATAAEDKAMAQADKHDMMMGFGRWGAAVLLGLAFLIFLRSMLKSWRPLEMAESFPHPISLRDAEAMALSPESTEARLQGDTGMELLSDSPAGPSTVRSLANRRPSDVALENPEDVTKLVRTWLGED